MKSWTSAGLIVVLALLVGCAPKPAATPVPPPPPALPDATALRAELGSQIAKEMATLESKDAAGLAAFFADDATWILPDASISKGKAEVETTAKAFFETFESATIESVAIDHLVVISDTEALTFTTAIYNVTMKGQKPQRRRNPFADYWKKGADGVWRIAYEVNAEGPAPAATPAP